MLKGLVFVLVGGISAYILSHSAEAVRGQGREMAAGGPIVLGTLLWQTASITKRRRVLRGDLIWLLLGGMILVPSLVIAVTEPSVRMISSSAAGLCLIGLSAPLLRRRWIGWREAYIAKQQAALEPFSKQ